MTAVAARQMIGPAGYDPLQIGLAFLPVAAVTGTLSVRCTDRLVMRFGARGAGLCFPALMALAMSSATPQDAGLASGLVNATALTGGYRLAFWIACGLVVTGR